MPKKPREIVRAYIGLGSNLGDRSKHIDDAVRELGALGEIVAVSHVFETAPIGPTQDDYLNACVALDTGLSATGLLAALVAIECAHGRLRAERWGPRTLDLDLLLYGALVLDTAELKVPHPEMHRRGFVLAPLSEIAPNTLVPTQGKSVSALWAEWLLKDGTGVQRYGASSERDGSIN